MLCKKTLALRPSDVNFTSARDWVVVWPNITPCVNHIYGSNGQSLRPFFPSVLKGDPEIHGIGAEIDHGVQHDHLASPHITVGFPRAQSTGDQGVVQTVTSGYIYIYIIYQYLIRVGISQPAF